MTRARRVLLLGGTTEAATLARRLADRTDVRVVTSLAGRTANPVAPPGELRVGGFGGIGGLVAYLQSDRIDVVVDATHPFAAVMRWHAAAACEHLELPRLRVERPPWSEQPADRWVHVPSVAAAGPLIAAGQGTRVFLTVGRSELHAFSVASDPARWWLVRSIDAPRSLPLQPAEVVLGRGPFSFDDELALMRRHRIDLLVTKNSGGDAAAPKLDAARLLGVPTVVVDRPASPEGPTVGTVEAALVWIDAAL